MLVPKSTSEEEIQRIFHIGRNNEEVRAPLKLASLEKGAKETLEVLNKEYALGIVTSRTTKGVNGIPSLQPILPLFKTIVTQDDTKNHKPDPEPLLLAANKLNIYPNECVYVGDAKTDMQAAVAAGMKFVLYRYRDISFLGPDATCSDLYELPQAIASL